MPVKEYTNRLIDEKSPYLLQHAHNPVDWYPWGEEAFKKAKQENKPVFLSIGYSACHWCHVMERESFEDKSIGKILNQNFVSIKVDREERPDVDHMYMEACTAMTGQGGWPLSCFLTPDRKPFFAGTYFPKDDYRGMAGFRRVLTAIDTYWKQDRQRIIETSEDFIREIAKKDLDISPKNLEDKTVHDAFRQLEGQFDRRYGGFGAAPKFPSAHNLLFLLQYGLLFKSNSALDMVKKTLTSMYSGAIFDHIGGGFCRYSTDHQWLVPHFEKMLYDNAVLAQTYSFAGAALDEKFFHVTEKIFDFCFDALQDGEGGFYTALDADSEGVEGKYYVFTPEEIKNVLEENNAKKFCALYDITEKGNFEGKNIPNLIGKELSAEEETFAEKAISKLKEYRKKRVPPFRDDKILASSNGLMISALAFSGRIMKKQTYIKAAEKNARFILNNLFKNGRLYSSYRQGISGQPAAFDDYAYLANGLFELYEATYEPEWLKKTIDLCGEMERLFWDENAGNFYLSGSDVKDLPLRGKTLTDGALPSGNSVAAGLFLRLSALTENEHYEKTADRILSSVYREASAYPSAFTAMLSSQMFKIHGGIKIIISDGDNAEKLSEAAQSFGPFTVSALIDNQNETENIIPDSISYTAKDGKAAAYICSKGICNPPVLDEKAIYSANLKF